MRMARLVISLLILSAAGCQNRPDAPQAAQGSSEQPPAVPSPSPPPAPGASPTLGPVTTLNGAWRVAGIDGLPLEETYGIALSGNDRELWWEPRCAGLTRRYRISARGISFGPIVPESPPSAPGSPPPPPTCEIAAPPRVADVMRALDAAVAVERTQANGVLISGGEHSVILFSQ